MTGILLALALLAGAGLSGAPVDSRRAAARRGDGGAMLELGDDFFLGRGRPVNRVLAAYWYRCAAESGRPEGRYKFGLCLEHGWGVKADVREAFAYYAGAQNYPAARLRLGKLLYTGVPGNARFSAVNANPAGALELLRVLCRQSYPPAFLELARLLDSQPALRRTHGREIRALLARRLELAAAPPDPALLVFYSDVLQRGVGGTPDFVLARALLEVAAESGHAPGQRAFAQVLEFGRGCPANPDRALDYYLRAAKGGDAAALVRLGDYRLAGDRLPLDPVMARRYYRQAAEKSFPPAWRKLGWCRENGIGGAVDLRSAFLAYERAAHGGDPAGNFALGRCFRDGVGVAADPAGAAWFFRRAAELDCPGAQAALNQLAAAAAPKTP